MAISIKALNAVAIALHGTSAVLGTLLITNYGGDHKIGIYAPLVEFNDGSASNNGMLYKSTPRHIFDARIFLPGVLFEWLTAFAHIIYLRVEFLPTQKTVRVRGQDELVSPRQWVAIKASGYYSEREKKWYVSRAYNPLRFWEYSVTATIMQVGGLCALGIVDFYYFILAIATNVALQVVGYILEIMDRDSEPHQRVAAIILNMFTVITLAQLFALFFQMFASKTHHLNIFLYVIIPNFVLWNSFGLVARSDFYKRGPFKDAVFTEKAYMALSIGTKLSLFWIQTSTFHEIAESLGTVPSVPGVDWGAVRWISGFGITGLLVLYAAVEWWRYNKAVAKERPKSAAENRRNRLVM